MQAGIGAAAGDQRLVRPGLGDAARLHHDDQVGVADGGEPVGDDEGRAALHQPRDGVLHQALGFGIERAGRLVEQQDRARP